MDLKPNEVKYRKKIGRIGNAPVFEVGMVGGLYVVTSGKGGSWDVIGLGSHRAIARHIAKKKEPDMVITELSKADNIEVSSFERFLPYWEQQTDLFRERARQRQG